MSTSRKTARGFTLAEMLVATVVLIIIVLFVTQLVNHASVIVGQGTKHMDSEAYTRALFDRIAVDVAQMVKRTDISYYVKNLVSGSVMGNGIPGVNDRMAFFSSGPGYYDTAKVVYNSGYSLIAYRVNSDPASSFYNKVERMAKGLPLNGAYVTPPSGSNATVTPLLFLDSTIATTIGNVWPTATAPVGDPNYYCCSSCTPCNDPEQAYERVASQVFRLEYYYLTSASPATLVASPPTWSDWNTVNIKDVAAIVVAVAVIDPQSKKLLGTTPADQDAQIAKIIQKLPDYTSAITNYGKPGALLAQWQDVLNTDGTIKAMPRPALQGIRLYERYFYLNQ
jgi:hypothetical protein